MMSGVISTGISNKTLPTNFAAAIMGSIALDISSSL